MWNLDKINLHIDEEIEENLHLDYKSAKSLSKGNEKKRELSKDVSAFANSDGGVIIYGIKEYDDKDKRHKPEKIDPVNRVQFSKEWLEQVINSSISPRIQNIEIYSIEVSKSKNEVVYVVVIPKSKTAHQAKDKRYYRRYNFESIMMEDWEIKDIINRNNKTDVKLAIRTNEPKNIILEKIEKGETFNIKATIYAKNEGNIACNYVEVFIGGKKETAKYFKSPKLKKNKKIFQIQLNNSVERKVFIGEEELIFAKEREPVLPNISRKIGDLIFSSDLIADEAEFEFLISTEDSSRTVEVKGFEIINGKKE